MLSNRHRILACKAGSVFQLLNGLGALHRVRQQTPDARGLFCLSNYWGERQLPDHYRDLVAALGGRLMNEDEFDAEVARRGEHGGISIVSSSISYQRPFSRIRSIEIDDGIGNYRTDAEEFHAALVEESLSLGATPPDRQKFLRRHSRREAKSRILPPERFTMIHRPVRGTPVADALYADSMSSVLAELVRLKGGTRCSDDRLGLLILPAMRLGSLAYSKDEVQQVAQSLAQTGLKVILRPHPADSDSDLPDLDFDYVVDRDALVAEEIMAEHPKCLDVVVGFNSTASLTARIVFGLRSCHIGRTVRDSGVRKIYSAFTEPFDDFLRLPAVRKS